MTDASRRPDRRDVLRAYLVLPHAVPIIAVLAATGAFGIVAAGGWPGVGNMFSLLGAMLGGQLAIGAVNELVDVELDHLSKPHKPIASGLVSERGAITVVALGLLMMALFSLQFSLEAFALCALGTGAGIAYSFWFKRTIWSWLPYVLAVPLIPIWVWTAFDSLPARMFAIYPVAIPAMVSLQIAQSVPDINSDRRARVRTLAVVLGEERARNLCWILAMLSLIAAAFLAPMVLAASMWTWIAGLVSLACIAGNIAIWRRDPHAGRMSCFPCIAAAIVVLGVGWTVGLVDS